MLSALASEHVANPRNRGPLSDFTHYGVAGSPGGGPYVEIWLITKDNCITSATYETHGCPSSVAASSVLCTLATGRDMEKMKNFDSRDLLLVLGGLPEGKEEFAEMAICAFSAAMKGGN